LELDKTVGVLNGTITVEAVPIQITLDATPAQLPQYENLDLKVTTQPMMARATVQFDGEAVQNMSGSMDTVFTLHKPMLTAGQYQFTVTVFDQSGNVAKSETRSITITPPLPATLKHNILASISLGQSLAIEVNSNVAVKNVVVKFGSNYGWVSLSDADGTGKRFIASELFDVAGDFIYTIEANDGRGNIQASITGALKIVDPNGGVPAITQATLNGKSLTDIMNITVTDGINIQVVTRAVSGVRLYYPAPFNTTRQLRLVSGTTNTWSDTVNITNVDPSYYNGVLDSMEVYAVDGSGNKITSTAQKFKIFVTK
jgi:hypothetical protein